MIPPLIAKIACLSRIIKSHNSKASSLSEIQIGFTLIELIVVVAILAILATIGISNYNGAQITTRDTRRLVEINGLAKSIESVKSMEGNSGEVKYHYSVNNFNEDYTNGLVDPKFSTGYCLKISATTIDKPANWNPRDNPCPTGFTEISSTMTPPAANLYFMVCAAVERGSDPICKEQLSR